VIVRAGNRYNLDFHIDREEWNAAGIKGQMFWKIVS
jgi:propanediol utilization protein